MSDSSATQRKDEMNVGNQKYRRNNSSSRRGGNMNVDNYRGGPGRSFDGHSNNRRASHGRGRGRGGATAPPETPPRQPGTSRTPEPEGASAPVSSWFPLPKTEAEEQEMLERAMAESHQEAKRNGFGVEEPHAYGEPHEDPRPTLSSAESPVPNRVLHQTAPPHENSPVELSAEDFVTHGARPKLVNKAPVMKTQPPPAEPKAKVQEHQPPPLKNDKAVQHFHTNDTIDHSLADINLNNADSTQWSFPKHTEVPRQLPVTVPAVVLNTQPENIILPHKPDTAFVPAFSVDVVAEPEKSSLPESESMAPLWLKETLQSLRDRIDALQQELLSRPTREEICNTSSQMPPPMWAVQIMQTIDTMNHNLVNQQQMMTTMSEGPSVSDLSATAREFIPLPTYEVPCQSYDSTQISVDQQPEMVPVYFAQGTPPMYQIPRGTNLYMPRTNGRGHRQFVKNNRIYRNGRPM